MDRIGTLVRGCVLSRGVSRHRVVARERVGIVSRTRDAALHNADEAGCVHERQRSARLGEALRPGAACACR